MQKRGVERRRAMVDAAIELFGRHGYAATGVAAVAERAGVTPSAVIHHFGSKDNLLQAVLDEFDARAAARLGAVPETLDDLKAALLADADHTMRHRGLATLHAVLQAEHLARPGGVRERFLRRNRVLRRAFARFLDEDRAAELVAFLEGALVLWLLDPEAVDLRALYGNYLRRL
ncbi:TetR/AcrR family transcriptional regulator [Actinosynnema sp. NPDC059797]